MVTAAAAAGAPPNASKQQLRKEGVLDYSNIAVAQDTSSSTRGTMEHSDVATQGRGVFHQMVIAGSAVSTDKMVPAVAQQHGQRQEQLPTGDIQPAEQEYMIALLVAKAAAAAAGKPPKLAEQQLRGGRAVLI